jgi:ATP synthase protein I
MVAPRLGLVLHGAAVLFGSQRVGEPSKDDGLGDTARAERGAAPYLAAVWRMVGALLLGAAVGVVVDKKWGWGPWGVVSGLGVGLVVGFMSLLQSLNRLGKRS